MQDKWKRSNLLPIYKNKEIFKITETIVVLNKL